MKYESKDDLQAFDIIKIAGYTGQDLIDPDRLRWFERVGYMKKMVEFGRFIVTKDDLAEYMELCGHAPHDTMTYWGSWLHNLERYATMEVRIDSHWSKKGEGYILQEAEPSNARCTFAIKKLLLKICKEMANVENFEAVELNTYFPIVTGRGGMYERHYYIYDLGQCLARRGLVSLKITNQITKRKVGWTNTFVRFEWTDLAKQVFDAELIKELARVSSEGVEKYMLAAELVGNYFNSFKVKKRKGKKIVELF